MKYDVLEEQFSLLFESIETISNCKNLEDKFSAEMKVFKENFSQLSDQL